MADTVAELMVKISGDASGLKGAVDDAKSSVKELGSAITGIGAISTAVLTVPLVAIGTAAVKSADDVNGAMRQIQRETGLTGTALAQAQTAFKELFASVPADAGSIGTALTLVIQKLDIAIPKAEALTKQFLDLSRMTGTDVATNIDSVSSSFNAWNVSADQMGSKLDALYVIYQNTGQSVADIADTTAKAELVTQNAGLTYEQTAIMVAQLGAAGVPTRNVLSSINTVVMDAAKNNRDAATEWTNLVNKFKDPAYKATADDIKILGNNTEKFAAMARQGDLDFGPLLQKIKDSPNAIENMATKTMTLGESFQVLRNRMELALTPLGTALGNAAQGLINSFEPLFKLIEQLGTAFGKLPVPIQQVVLVIGTLLAAIGPLLVGFGPILSGLATLTSAWGGSVLSLVTSLGPLAPLLIVLAPAIALVAATIATMVAGFIIAYEASATLRKTIDQVATAFKDFGGHLMTAVGLLIGGNLQGALKEVTKGFQDLLTNLNKINWKSVGDTIVKEIQDSITNKQSTFNKIAQQIADWFKTVDWTAVGKTIGDLLVNAIHTFFTTSTLALDDVFAPAAKDTTGWQNLKTAAGNAWGAFKKAFTDALGKYYDSGQFETDLNNAVKAAATPVLKITASVVLTIGDVTIHGLDEALAKAMAGEGKTNILDLKGMAINVGVNITAIIFGPLILAWEILKWIIANFSTHEVGINISLSGMWATLVNIVYPALQWIVEHLIINPAMAIAITGDVLLQTAKDLWDYMVTNLIVNPIMTIQVIGADLLQTAKSLWDSFVSKTVTLTQTIVQAVIPSAGTTTTTSTQVPIATSGTGPTVNTYSWQTGAVTNTPHLAMIGEGGEAEAVIPQHMWGKPWAQVLESLPRYQGGTVAGGSWWSSAMGANLETDLLKELLVTSKDQWRKMIEVYVDAGKITSTHLKEIGTQLGINVDEFIKANDTLSKANTQRDTTNTNLDTTNTTLDTSNINTGTSATNTTDIATNTAQQASCGCSGAGTAAGTSSTTGGGTCAGGSCAVAATNNNTDAVQANTDATNNNAAVSYKLSAQPINTSSEKLAPAAIAAMATSTDTSNVLKYRTPVSGGAATTSPVVASGGSVTIYTQPGCRNCPVEVARWKAMGYQVNEIDISGMSGAQLQQLGITQTPTTRDIKAPVVVPSTTIKPTVTATPTTSGGHRYDANGNCLDCQVDWSKYNEPTIGETLTYGTNAQKIANQNTVLNASLKSIDLSTTQSVALKGQELVLSSDYNTKATALRGKLNDGTLTGAQTTDLMGQIDQLQLQYNAAQALVASGLTAAVAEQIVINQTQQQLIDTINQGGANADTGAIPGYTDLVGVSTPVPTTWSNPQAAINNPSYPLAQGTPVPEHAPAYNAVLRNTAQFGYSGLVTSPTLTLAGEAGPEWLEITPLSGGSKNIGGAKYTIIQNVDGKLDAKEIAKEVTKALHRAQLLGGSHYR